MIFENREHAARLLVERLARYENKNPLLLGIPRGAMPMAKILADALGGELDVVLVRKLGYPGQPELAIGAVDEGGRTFLADYAAEAGAAYIEEEIARQLAVIRERRERFTPHRQPIDPHGRTVIVVDDGIATGSTMIAALRAVRQRRPERLIAAAGVASRQALRAMAPECDEIVCLSTPVNFGAVGAFFRDFKQVSDDDVVRILRPAPTGASAAG